MDPNSGELYESMEEALRQGKKEEDLVEIKGTKEQVEMISEKIELANRAMSAGVKTRKRKKHGRQS